LRWLPSTYTKKGISFFVTAQVMPVEGVEQVHKVNWSPYPTRQEPSIESQWLPVTLAGVSTNTQLTLRVDHLMKAAQCRGEDRYWDSLS
jgi:hypothetical protein